MSWLILTAVLAAAPPPKPLPTLPKRPTVDAKLRDLAPALELKIVDDKTATATVRVKLAYFKDSLFIGAAVQDDVLKEDDTLDVTLYFPESGPMARGYTYRFNMNGAVKRVGDGAPPESAQKLVKAQTELNEAKKVFTLEAELPMLAWPRFQAKGPLLLSACVDYVDTDAALTEPTHVTSCPSGDMVGGPTRVPDELRRVVKMAPPESVEGIEGRDGAWLGYGAMASPTWLMASVELTPTNVADWVSNLQALKPESVSLAMPKTLTLLQKDTVVPVLTGRNPYVGDKCVSSNELRVWLYVVRGHEAFRALDWPAANCQLGRAMQFELSDEGNLTIGYSNGATARFTWADDHFERSELGLR